MTAHDDLPWPLSGFNRPRLLAVRDAFGGMPPLIEVLDLFVERFADTANTITTAWEAGDRKQVRLLAHTLKGAAGTIAALDLANVADAVEKAARVETESPEGDIGLLLPDLGAALAIVCTSIAQLQAVSPQDAASEAGATTAGGGASSPAKGPPGMRTGGNDRPGVVLVIDDEPINIRVLGESLIGAYEILCATSGEDGLRLAQSEQPDLVLLDVVMPGVDGYEVCRRLKADPATQRIPVIFITGLTLVEDEAKGLEIGAIDYITKPISPPIVRARVKNHLELKRYRDLLENLSMSDGLTGIANRRRFDAYLTQEWHRAIRSGAPLSLLMLDVDHFKLFNDTYGHAAGDDCLRQVACVLDAATHRVTDLAARYGGEEFACILPDTPLEGAITVAEQVLQGVVALMVPHSRSSVATHVTVSIGVVTMMAGGNRSEADLVCAADTLLYRAKAEGRNRLCSDALISL